MSRPRVKLKRLPHGADLPLPEPATGGAAGADLRAAEEVVLEPGGWAAVATGLAVELPPGTEAQVRPRSGLARHHGVTVLNGPGTVDCDYRGELQILLINHGRQPYRIQRGERIAQMVVARVLDVEFEAADELSESARGASGFGSSGKT